MTTKAPTFRLFLSSIALGATALACGAPSERRPPTPHDPTATRIPKPSKALSLAEDWQPPEPTVSRPARRKPRAVVSHDYGVGTAMIPDSPTDAQLRAIAQLPEPLVPLPGVSSPSETRALAAALRTFQFSPEPWQLGALAQFVRANPTSRWAPILRLNLGLVAAGTAHFEEALRHWRAAWNTAKSGADPVSRQIADRAIAEYAYMSARLGRADEVDALFAEVQDRDFAGDARVKMHGAVEARSMMDRSPRLAFGCGAAALSRIAPLVNPTSVSDTPEVFERTQASPRAGFSLKELAAMSADLGLGLQVARRSPGSAVIVPSVVHWKVGHYGALVREERGAYLLEDRVVENRIWIGEDALDEEGSGFFLVPEGPLPAGWRAASVDEAAMVYGKGATGIRLSNPTGQGSPQTPKCPGGPTAMATYTFHILLTSLHIEDTPVGYSSAFGPDVRVMVANNQREAGQPATLDFTNWSPQWVSDWVSYIEDNPSSPNANVHMRTRGGGGEDHEDYNSTAQTYGAQLDGSVLHKLTSNTYKKVYPDGRQEYYEQYIGTTGPVRRVFLTRVRDPQGNEASLEYNTTYPARIDRIVDAAGLQTDFFYTYSGQPYLVTAIEDPYGRQATFTYSTVDGIVRLQSIEDVIGIISSFTYNSSGEIDSFTTPYGTTTFSLSPLMLDVGHALISYVEATDPYLDKERIEYNLDWVETGIDDSLESPLPDSSVVNFYNYFINDRNSFYWDKLQMRLAPGDYTKAHLYHWATPGDYHTATDVLESEKPPLEGRIFYNYPGQNPSAPYIQGTLRSPSVVARVITSTSGNTTRAYRYEYNSQGNRTKLTDPIGRETLIEYASNGIDVVAIKQKTGESGGVPVYAVTSSLSYDASYPAHRVKRVTDAAGQATLYTYNSTTAQVATITNPLDEVVTFAYQTDAEDPAYGRLLSITGDVPGGDVSFTYDDHDRIRTQTSTDGITLTYDYDDLDRVTRVTYPDGSYEQSVYEDHSLVASRDRAGRWSRHTYNALNQRVLTRDAAGLLTQTQWCRCGELRRLVDPAGNITEWLRDVQGRVTQKVYADGSDFEYTYDFAGRLATEADALARTTTLAYTLDDRVKKIDYSDASTPDVTYTYDARFPRIATRSDGIGTTSYAYHPTDGETLGAGQLWRVNGPLTDDTIKYTYDELGRVAELAIVDDATYSTATSSEAYSFDARGRVESVENNLGAFDYAYVGQSSRVDTIDYPNGMQVDYDYYGPTSDRLLKQIKNLSAGPNPTTLSQFDYTYNQDRTISTWAINQGSGTTTWSFVYDALLQLTSAMRADTNENGLEAERYAYDAAGNRVQVVTGTTSTPTVRNFGVNNLNQLRSERGFGLTTVTGTLSEPATVTVNGQAARVTSANGAAPYTFEAVVSLPAGTSTITVQATDGSNNTSTNTYEVTTTATATLYSYDLNGNLRYEREPDQTLRREMQWDQENRLTRIIDGAHESVFEYDGESRRVRIRELENSVEVSNHTFVWCGGRICQTRTGTTVARNYFGLGFEAGGVQYFTTTDHLGSVREVVASNGTTLESAMSFSPWGEREQIAGAGMTSDMGYTGHFTHEPSGLALPWFRAYSSADGRWLSRDPIAESGGINLYGYVSNDPINMIDPTGQFPWPGLPECTPPDEPEPAPTPPWSPSPPLTPPPQYEPRKDGCKDNFWTALACGVLCFGHPRRAECMAHCCEVPG